MKRVLYLLTLVALLASCMNQTPPINFVIPGGVGFSDFGKPHIESSPVTLFGTLDSIRFTQYTLQSNTVYTYSYYVKNRVFVEPNQDLWVSVTGTITKSLEHRDEYEIDIQHYESNNDIDTKVNQALTTTCQIVDEARSSYDLNDFKTTTRYKNFIRYGIITDSDLNNQLFRSENELYFVDSEQMIAGINCGSTILREDSRRGDFITFLAIVDLNTMNIEKVLVANTGYFLE